MKKLLLFALVLVSFTGRIWAEDDKDKVSASIIKAQDDWKLSVSLTNSLEYVAFQMDIQLDKQVDIDNDGFTATSRMAGTDVHPFIIASNCVDATSADKYKYRVIAYNYGNEKIVGNAGEFLFSAILKSTEKPKVVDITNVLFVQVDEKKNLSEETLGYQSTLLGDANQSGSVNVTDITAVVSCIYGNKPTGFNMTAADVNANGVINVTDITGIVSIIYGGSSSSAPREAKLRDNVETSISLPSVSVLPGSEVRVPIYIENADCISAFQFDAILPEGVVATGVEQSLDNRPGIGGYVDDVHYRVMSYSSSNNSFFDSSVPVAYLTLNADQNLAPGTYDIALSTAVVAADGDEQIPSLVNGTLVVVDPSSITNIDAENDANTEIITVGGVKIQGNEKLEKLPKNVYIINGKKQIAK